MWTLRCYVGRKGPTITDRREEYQGATLDSKTGLNIPFDFRNRLFSIPGIETQEMSYMYFVVASDQSERVVHTYQYNPMINKILIGHHKLPCGFCGNNLYFHIGGHGVSSKHGSIGDIVLLSFFYLSSNPLSLFFSTCCFGLFPLLSSQSSNFPTVNSWLVAGSLIVTINRVALPGNT